MGNIAHLSPSTQPRRVHEMTDRLYPAYRIDSGDMKLAGCHLQDRLFVRFHFHVGDQVVSIIVDSDGSPVDDMKIDQLGMDELVSLAKPPAPYAEKIEKLGNKAQEILRQRLGNPDVEITLAGSDAVWCKFAAGKLRFEVGDASVDLEFSGWSRTLEAPAYVCPHTGVQTYHLAATDDGRIAAAEQIGECAETGRRVLVEELATCSATGSQVLRELVSQCDATGEPVLVAQLVTCPTCGKRVSPTATEGQRCSGCDK